MSTIESPVFVFNPQVALVQAAEPQWPEVDVPDSVVDLLQSDVLADTDRRDFDPLAVPANAAVPTDVPDFEAIGILERRYPVRHRPGRGGIALRRGCPVERLVRPLIVELLSEGIEAPLLGGEIPRCRPRRLRFEGAVHPLVPSVLVRPSRLDKLRHDSQPNPPRGELRQPPEGLRGERHAVVRPDPFRQTILLEHPRE